MRRATSSSSATASLRGVSSAPAMSLGRCAPSYTNCVTAFLASHSTVAPAAASRLRRRDGGGSASPPSATASCQPIAAVRRCSSGSAAEATAGSGGAASFTHLFQMASAAAKERDARQALKLFEAAHGAAVNEMPGKAASHEALATAVCVGRMLVDMRRPADAMQWLQETVLPHRDTVLAAAAAAADEAGAAAAAAATEQPSSLATLDAHPIQTALDADRVLVAASITLGDRRAAADVLTGKTIPLLERVLASSAASSAPPVVPNAQQVLDDMRCAAGSCLVGLASFGNRQKDAPAMSKAEAEEDGVRGIKMLRSVCDGQDARVADVPVGVRFRARETLWQAVADVCGEGQALAEIDAAVTASSNEPADAALFLCVKQSVLMRAANLTELVKCVEAELIPALSKATEATTTEAQAVKAHPAVEIAAEALEAMLERTADIAASLKSDRGKALAVAYAEALEALSVQTATLLLRESKLPHADIDENVIRVRVALATALQNLQTEDGWKRCAKHLRTKLLHAVRHQQSSEDPASGFRCYVLLGMCETALHRTAAAIDALQTSVAIARVGFGAEHRSTASAAHQLARALANGGKRAEALSLLKNAVRPVYEQQQPPGREQLVKILDADADRIRDKDAALADSALPTMPVDDALVNASPTPALLRLQRKVADAVKAGDAATARAVLEDEVFPKAMNELPENSAARWLELARAVSALARIDGAAATKKSREVVEAWRALKLPAGEDAFIDPHNASPANVRLMLEAQNALLMLGHATDMPRAAIFAVVQARVLSCIDSDFDGGAELPADDCIALLYQLSSVISAFAAKGTKAAAAAAPSPSSSGAEGAAATSELEEAKQVGLALLERLCAISTARRGPAARETLMLRITAGTEQMTVRGDAERAMKDLSEAAMDGIQAFGAESVEVYVAKLRLATVLAAAGALPESAGMLAKDVVPGLETISSKAASDAAAAGSDADAASQQALQQNAALAADSLRAAKTLLGRVEAAVAAAPTHDGDGDDGAKGGGI